MLQQVDGRQRTRDKLPTFSTFDDWWYPVRLSCEQCSSEHTARYKASLLQPSILPNTTFIDLTGGYGVDSFFISEHFQQAHYVEQNPELCRIATHNFSTHRPHLQVHNATAEQFLQNLSTQAEHTTIFIDPARRNHSGGKVFLLHDCEPNVIHLLPLMLSKAQHILIKLSPMLDITAALKGLPAPFEVHVLALQGEVKEVLLHTYPNCLNGLIHAVNILSSEQEQVFAFSIHEEQHATSQLSPLNSHLSTLNYIYEPNAAILKAGAYKLVAQRYQLLKMAPNTHLYLSEQYIADFPGRVWQIIEHNPKNFKDIRASIMTRNYPLTPEQLRKKLKINDSNTHTIIGARLADKPTLFLCKKM